MYRHDIVVFYRVSPTRVQLISDELDEIKVRLDTLHHDMEQDAIDQIEGRLAELLARIRDKHVSRELIVLRSA